MQASFLSHADAALRNRNNILHFVKKQGSISRTEIWETLNISRASVTQIIRQLQDIGLIVETGAGESTGGRKPIYVAFNGASKKYYAFDWSSRTLCLMDLDGRILVEKTINFATGLTPVAFAAAIEAEIAHIESMSLYTPDELIGFGIALPGLIDHIRGIVLYSIELGWQNVSLHALFHERFGDQIYLERTGNVMALGAERSDDARNVSHFQLIILSSDGIGASAVVHGSCQHGANYMYGELGHIKIPSDVICSCGQRGCLEAVIGDLMVKNGGIINDQVLEYLSIVVSTAINISDAGYSMLVGSYVDTLTSAQKLTLTDLIQQKLTGRHLRNVKICFCHDMRKLAFDGICANVFDRYFSVD